MVNYKKGDTVICIDDDCVMLGFSRKSYMKKGWVEVVRDTVSSEGIILENNKNGINFKPSAFKKYNPKIELW